MLNQQTLYISDVGMTGPHLGILGVKKETIIARLWKQEKNVFELADDGESVLSAVYAETNDQTNLVVDSKTILFTDKVK
jgi:calcineurin-like phosphoesterase